MKNLTLTLAALFLFSFSQLNATIHHTTFGDDGWTIGLNENVVVDFDEDGQNDFYINGWDNELSFVPIFAQGCFAGTGDHTAFGAYELLRFKTGQFVHFNSNPYYIDGERGSMTSPAGDLAENWTDNTIQYLGLMVWTTGVYGWVKLSVDSENGQMTIYEWAYNDVNDEGINVGDTGAAPVGINDLSEEVTELSLTPNPAVDQTTLRFNYNSDQNLDLVVINSVGQKIYTQPLTDLPAQNTIVINTVDLSDGIYYVQLKTNEGIRVEKFLVAK